MGSTALLVSPPPTAAPFNRSLNHPFSSSRNPNPVCPQSSRSIRTPPLRPSRLLECSPAAKLKFRCSAVTSIGHDEFSVEVLQSEVPVLVEFVANWCGPCRLISPVIDWASQEYKDKLKIVKIDHDANPQLIEEYKVYGLPGFILFKNGREVPESRREGAITKAKLKDYLDSLLGSASTV